MSNYEEYNGIHAFHPGYYISEIAEELGITQTELSLRLGVSAKTISQLVNGKSRITDEIALKLSAMTGTSIVLWTGLQSEYDKKIQEIAQEHSLEDQHETEKGLCYKFFVKVAGLPPTRNWRERIMNLCSYLHVSNLNILGEQSLVVNFRRGVRKLNFQNIVNAQAWVQIAVNIAREDDVGKVKLDVLEMNLQNIREMTLKSPSEFLPELRKIFKESGISFVLLPYLANSCINGAVKWLDKKHVVIAINDRRCYADTFWFSLFHEIKHILQQKLKRVFLSYERSIEYISDDEAEKEADKFSQDTLIPMEKYLQFVNKSNLGAKDIREFASLIGIHAGILVGRLQHDGYIKRHEYNELREKYKILV